jgi:hypothetical protein
LLALKDPQRRRYHTGGTASDAWDCTLRYLGHGRNIELALRIGQA